MKKEKPFVHHLARMLHCALLVGLVPFLSLTGCGASMVKALNLADYPDPPEDQRYELLSIYVAWNGAGGETWTYEVSADDVIEEGSPPPQPEDDEFNIYIDEELPGGRTIWFKGVSPGAVELTFTTKDDSGKVVAIQQYAIRVYEDLRLALLHEEYNNFRS